MQTEKWSEKSINEVLSELEVNADRGLSSADVLLRIEKYGRNVFPEESPKSFFQRVKDQFDDSLVRILLVAACVSYGISAMEGSYYEIVEPGIILLILIANAIVGVLQEKHAEGAAAALKTYTTVIAKAYRDGKLVEVHAEDLVPGDIVEVSVGDRVPADLRLLALKSTTLRTDQSILTGEFKDVVKGVAKVPSHAVSQRFPFNMLFCGTAVVYGKGVGVVVATGMATEIGSIQYHVQTQEEEKTPLQVKLDEFGVWLSKAIGWICILVFSLQLLQWYHHFDPTLKASFFEKYGVPFVHAVKVAIALAVAAIPEGLPAVVTISLALGTQRLSKQNALIRDLASVETLGRCKVICTDKTGTLTCNRMSVTKVLTLDAQNAHQFYHLRNTDYNVAAGSVFSSTDELLNDSPLKTNAALNQLATIAVLCNDAALEYDDSRNEVKKIGEATEGALLVMAEKLALESSSFVRGDVKHFRLEAERLWRKAACLEFSRCRKSMSVLCQPNNLDNTTEELILMVKGAPETLLERSCSVLRSDGSIVALSPAVREQLDHCICNISEERRWRSLAFAFKSVSSTEDLPLDDPSRFNEVESDLTFVGACFMNDPPRLEIAQSLLECHSAGIRVIMITGDKKETAVSVAQTVGLLPPGPPPDSRVFTGEALDQLTSEEMKQAVLTGVVFCRTDPSHKLAIVNALQEQKFISAMTGDGVNDAPALKRASIGVSMGSGTEVAKAASNLILEDDNFATILTAVREGRCMYDNTRQFIRYLISSNIGEVVSVLLIGLCGLPEALTPIQLLWVNLVTDGLPATALSFNKPAKGIMRETPRELDEPIVSRRLFVRYLIVGLYVGLCTVISSLWWFSENGYTWDELRNIADCKKEKAVCDVLLNPETARAIALSTLVFVEMFNALNCLSESASLLVTRPMTNPWLIMAIASSIFLHLMIMYIPIFASTFGITPLGVPSEVLAAASPWSVVLPVDFREWRIVLLCSFPVIVVDELLKWVWRSDEEKKSCGKRYRTSF